MPPPVVSGEGQPDRVIRPAAVAQGLAPQTSGLVFPGLTTELPPGVHGTIERWRQRQPARQWRPPSWSNSRAS